MQECPKFYLQYFPSPCSPYFNIWKGKQRWNTNSWWARKPKSTSHTSKSWWQRSPHTWRWRTNPHPPSLKPHPLLPRGVTIPYIPSRLHQQYQCCSCRMTWEGEGYIIWKCWGAKHLPLASRCNPKSAQRHPRTIFTPGEFRKSAKQFV